MDGQWYTRRRGAGLSVLPAPATHCASATGLRNGRPRGRPSRRTRHGHRAGPQARGPGCARHAARRRFARRSSARRFASWCAAASVSRSPSATSPALSRGAKCSWPSSRRCRDVRPEDVTILIATGTHRTNTDARARADARPRHSEPLPGRSITTPRSLDARTRRHDIHRRAGVAQSPLARRRLPHHDRASSNRTSSRDSAAVPRWWRRAWPGSRP